MRFQNQVAIVTGGGTGIGKAICLALANEGAAVVVAARTQTYIEQVAKEINLNGGRAIPVQTDISDESQVQNMVQQTIKDYDHIDVLVNNAAFNGVTANVVDIKLEDWNVELAVGLTGTMICSRDVLKYMVPRKSGNIVNISSHAGTVGYAMRSPYSVVKWGMIGFTQSLALEVGEYNIRVNAVAPAWVEGERLERAMRARAQATGRSYQDVYQEHINARANSRAALRRIVTPEGVANTVIFLASNESSGIMGETIEVNAGLVSA
jgi:NAD(P)-dependent dehydrogenase (short-subunit alcohol dehydrogenase family)